MKIPELINGVNLVGFSYNLAGVSGGEKVIGTMGEDLQRLFRVVWEAGSKSTVAKDVYLLKLRECDSYRGRNGGFLHPSLLTELRQKHRDLEWGSLSSGFLNQVFWAEVLFQNPHFIDYQNVEVRQGFRFVGLDRNTLPDSHTHHPLVQFECTRGGNSVFGFDKGGCSLPDYARSAKPSPGSEFAA